MGKGVQYLIYWYKYFVKGVHEVVPWTDCFTDRPGPIGYRAPSIFPRPPEES